MPTRNSRYSNLFALFCLIGTVWTVVATSTVGGTIYGAYKVKSDCVSPVQDLSITVSSSTITSPVGYSFTNLGFPNATLVLGQPNSGTFSGLNRVCELSFRNDYNFTDNFLYTCYDEGQFACNIYFN